MCSPRFHPVVYIWDSCNKSCTPMIETDDECLYFSGIIAPWSGRFYSLWDTGYAKIHIPIIASVSEHQPTTWSSFFFDLHILSCAFPAGLWFCIKKVNDERVFSESVQITYHQSTDHWHVSSFDPSHIIRHLCFLLCWSHGQIDVDIDAVRLRVGRCRVLKYFQYIFEGKCLLPFQHLTAVCTLWLYFHRTMKLTMKERRYV